MAGPLSDANESLRFELTVNNCVHSVSFDANMLQSPARSTYPHGGSLCGALGPMADEMKDTADAKLRILALTHQYPRLGNELFAPYNRHQIRCLSHGHDIRVIAPIAWTGLFRGGYADHLTCPRHYLNKDNLWVDHPPYFYPPKLLEHRYGDFYLLSIRKTVRRIIDEFKPGVIFSCWSHPDGWAAVRLAREHGLPVLIKVVGSDVLVLARNPRRRERVAEALREADGVIAVSRDLAEHVVELGVNPARVHLVPHGIDQELFCPGDPQEARARLGLEGGPDGSASLPRLLFVGNLLLSKGAGVLLEACALLRRGGLDFRCHLVGRGQDEPRLRALAGRLGLEGVAAFAGPCPQWKLPDWYRACDLTVLPSFSEGIPNVLREAMMCGRGFVATRVGGIPEITRPSVGRLVDPGDPRQLADAIGQALSQGLAADRATALELNISWEQSARLLAQRLRAVTGRPKEQGVPTAHDRLPMRV